MLGTGSEDEILKEALRKIIDYNFLSRFDVAIDYRKHRLELEPQENAMEWICSAPGSSQSRLSHC